MLQEGINIFSSLIAFLSVFTFLYGVGHSVVWASNRFEVSAFSTGSTMLEKGLLAIGLSLLGAFLLSQIVFYLNLPAQFERIVLYFVVMATSLNFLVSRREFKEKITAVDLCLVVLFVAASIVAMIGLSGYSLIFNEHDALVSYNRWGIELYFNEYYPTISTYPLLFPSIWSLIYKIQGDYSLQIVSKLTLFIIPILLMLSAILLLRTNMIAALWIIGLAGTPLLKTSPQMVSGLMDVPVAIIGLVGLSAIVCERIQRQRAGGTEPNFSYFIIGALFLGLAGAVKQPGWAYIFIGHVIILSDKEIMSEKPKRLLSLLTFLWLPPILNFVMFERGGVPFLSGYQTISTLHDVNHLDPSVQLTYAMKIVGSDGFSFLGLACFAVSNIIFIKTRLGQLGLFLAGSTYFSFVAYLDCCAYSTRNSYWIYSLLMLSAFLGAYNIFGKVKFELTNLSFSQPLVLRRFYSVFFYFVVTVLVLAAFRFPHDRLLKYQEDIESNKSSFVRAIKRNENLLTSDSIVLTSYQRVAYMTGHLDKFAIGKVSSGYKGKGRGFFDICTGRRFRSFPHKVYSVEKILQCKDKVFIIDISSKLRAYNLEQFNVEVISDGEGVTFAEISRLDN